MTKSQAAVIANKYIAADGGPAAVAHVTAQGTVTVAAGAGHNGAPEPTPYELVRQEIDDLYQEAKNWADGAPISNEDQHAAVTHLFDAIHEAGKRADQARVDEKKPYDEAIKEIQDRFNLLIGNTKSARGKVTLAKEALSAVLGPWRKKVADEKEAAAKAAREEADNKLAEATAAIRESAGNLEAREEAEAALKGAKAADRGARRADREATTSTGLRSVWHADMKDESAALDWAFGRDHDRFRSLAQSIADEAVRGGLRVIPGFDVREERVAR